MATRAQDHIHLDTALGGADGGPTSQFIALGVSPEVREFIAHIAVEFAVDATTLVHQVTSAGSVVTTQKRPVNLRLTRANVTTLLGFLGEYCYFIPSYHPDVGSPHAASAVQVYFVRLQGLQSAEKRDLEHFNATAILQYTAA